MSERVTLELPEDLARRARAAAAESDRRLEEVLVEWIDRAASEPAVDSLADADILARCVAEMDPGQQQELAELLDRNREGGLPAPERERLDELMHIYRRGLVRKAQALKVAVERGLKPRLDRDDAAIHPR